MTFTATFPRDARTLKAPPRQRPAVPPLAASRHIPALDGLRGTAILLVLAFKAMADYQTQTWGGRAIAGLCGCGWAGVDLFFVLSGFLITGILLDSKGGSHFFRTFYARRTLRIFPLYYGALLVAFVIIPAIAPITNPDVQHIARNQAWLWTYTSNMAFAGKHKVFFNADWLRLNHFWSLAIEEQFYLIWPMVVFALDSARLKKICWILVFGALSLRLGIYLAHLPRSLMLYPTPCRSDSLSIGALLAIGVRETNGVARLLPIARRGAAVFGVLLIPAFFWPENHPADDRTIMLTVGYTLLAAFSACLLLLVLDPSPRNKLRQVLEHSAVRTLGKYSYCMYVAHMFVLAALEAAWPLRRAVAWSRFEPAGMLLFFATYIAATLAIAIVSWKVFETHFIKAKRLFQYETNRVEPVSIATFSQDLRDPPFRGLRASSPGEI
jgi:peptidoglycan/LPS O-acetylase OafA/YrhL